MSWKNGHLIFQKPKEKKTFCESKLMKNSSAIPSNKKYELFKQIVSLES